MKANIKLSLSLLNAVRLLALLRNVVAKLTGNAFFPTPPVTLAEMTSKGDALEAAIEEATDGSKASKVQRDVLIGDAQEMLRTVADYVRMEAKGDAAKLATSGFELRRQPGPIGVPGMVQRLRALTTKSKGTLDIRWRHERGAYGYKVWWTESDPTVEANWQFLGYTTRASYQAKGLESYKAYWFTVSALGSAGEGLQADPAMGRAA